MESKENYVKVVYQSDPIGKEKIILYLTTFDIDRYNNELLRKKFAINVDLPFGRTTREALFTDNDNLKLLEKRLNDEINSFYAPFVEEVKDYLYLLKQRPQVYDNARNITNADKVICNNVEGNITNCDIIYCNVIKGKVINCDKIIYKKDEKERIVSL